MNDQAIEPVPTPSAMDDLRAALDRLEGIARFLDAAITIPGTGFRLGWDAIIGLIPVVGDIATAVVSGYIIHRGWQLGASPYTVVRMILNVTLDLVVGSVPVAGDILDAVWKANRMNVRLLRKELLGE